jgi:hypothetical protein
VDGLELGAGQKQFFILCAVFLPPNLRIEAVSRPPEDMMKEFIVSGPEKCL